MQPPLKTRLNFTDYDFEVTVNHIASGHLKLASHNDGFAYLLPKCYHFHFGVKSWGFERKNYFKHLLHFEIPTPRYGPTGCFIVTREKILQNSKEYYVSLIRTLAMENAPAIGHFFERTWSQVFHSNCSASTEYYCHLYPNASFFNGACYAERDDGSEYPL
eukprot:gene5999-8261_t